MSLTGKTICWDYFNKAFFLIFLQRQSGIIALTIKVIEHCYEEHQQFAVIYVYTLIYIICLNKYLFMYLKNLSYFVQLSTRKMIFA